MRGAVKAIFKDAAKTVTRPDPDAAPQPEAKRRGKGEGGNPTSPALRQQHTGNPRLRGEAARGRYAGLRSRPAAVPDPVVTAETCLLDTLDWMNPYEPPDNFTPDIDADFAPPQSAHFPHL